MSRWTDTFTNHPFQNSWKALKEGVSESRVNDETVITDVAELGRLKRVISYIDGLIRSLDPELVPSSVWNNFEPQASACAQQVSAFNSDKNIAHIKLANEHADNLLTYVRPYMVVTGRQAKNLRDSAAEYIKVLDEYLKSFHERVEAIKSHSQKTANEIDEFRRSAEAGKISIEAAVVDVLGRGDEAGKLGEIASVYSKAKEKYDSIVDFYNETLATDGDVESTEQEIKRLLDEARASAASTRDAINKSSSTIESLNNFHGKIFGTTTHDGAHTAGLDDEIRIQKESLSEFEKVQSTKYQALVRQIEDLLPGATSAGLASAYGQMRASFDVPLKRANRLFYVAIALIVTISLVTTVGKVWFWGVEFFQSADLATMSRNLLSKIPIIGPLVWLAYYASKRRSECQRLQQEYAHKEALAKSYDSYKKQIQDLGGERAELLEALITKAVEAIAHNASATLDGKHGDKIPLQTIVDKLIEKIPGSNTA
jgi:hypothetical protein